MKKNLEGKDCEKYFIEERDVIDKEGDFEDLFDPKIYYLAFKDAYDNILEGMPTFKGIQQKGPDKNLSINMMVGLNQRERDSIKPSFLNKCSK